MIIEQGDAFAQTVIEGADSALPFAVESLLPNALHAEAREKNRTANAVFELLTYLDSELMRVEYLGELSRLLGIREDILSNRLQKLPRDKKSSILCEQ